MITSDLVNAFLMPLCLLAGLLGSLYLGEKEISLTLTGSLCTYVIAYRNGKKDWMK